MSVDNWLTRYRREIEPSIEKLEKRKIGTFSSKSRKTKGLKAWSETYTVHTKRIPRR